MGDLSLLADLGLSDFDMGAIIDDLDMGSDEMLMAVAERIKLNPQFQKGRRGGPAGLSPGRGQPVGRADAAGLAACPALSGPRRCADRRCGVGPIRCRGGSGGNQRELARDPTAHAEILVLREAAAALGSWRLTEHTLVVTLEPCTMCAGALVPARVARLVFGAYDPKAGAVASLFDVVRDPRLNHRVDVRGGILEAECGAMLSDFFATR